MAVGGNQYVVFNSNAPPPRKIDARFDRYHHAGLQLVGGGGTKPRTFVNVEADAVSQAMSEASMSRPIDHASGNSINVATADTRANGSDRPTLCFDHNPIYFR